jgi:hypothetical protein
MGDKGCCFLAILKSSTVIEIYDDKFRITKLYELSFLRISERDKHPTRLLNIILAENFMTRI